MDVIKLKAFYTVAMLGSFSRAAEKLFFSSVKKEVAAGWLKSLVISDLDLFRRINIIYHKEKLISSALKFFMDFLLSKHPAVKL